MKTHIGIRRGLRFLLAWLALAPLSSFAAEHPSLREALRREPPINPATFKIANEVVVFDLWKYFEKTGITDTRERGDVVYSIVSLQGIVNREHPRLYLLTTLALFELETHGYPGIYNGPHPEMRPTNLDAFWLKEFEKKGYLSSVRKTDDLAEVIKIFHKDIQGLVLWELKVPATVNAALIAAGCDSLLPVSADLGKGRLRAWLSKQFPDLPVKMDLTNRFNGRAPIRLDDGRTLPNTGSAKNDVYRFAIQTWLKTGRTDPSYFWHDCDAIMLGSMRTPYCPPIYGKLGNQAEFQHNGMFNGDYWISHRAFVFDLMPWGTCAPDDEPTQPVGKDLATWNEMLDIAYQKRKGEFGIVGGFVPWWIKYRNKGEGNVAGEWDSISLSTSYNMVYDSDAAVGIGNASFFAHLPQVTPDELKSPPPPEVPYKNGTVYIAFCMMDFDGTSWANQIPTALYADPNRGKLPLNWCINPIIHRRIPQTMRYLYENRTRLDYFGFASNGAGYLNPMALTNRLGRVKESGIPLYEAFATDYYRRYAIEYNPYYCTRQFVAPWIEMASRLDRGFGFSQCPIPQQLVGGIPATFVPFFHVSQGREFDAEMLRAFADSEKLAGCSPLFKIYRLVVFTPSMVTHGVDEAWKAHPNAKVEIVDLRNFFALLKLKLVQPAQSSH
jgi:hypothetical protein